MGRIHCSLFITAVFLHLKRGYQYENEAESEDNEDVTGGRIGELQFGIKV